MCFEQFEQPATGSLRTVSPPGYLFVYSHGCQSIVCHVSNSRHRVRVFEFRAIPDKALGAVITFIHDSATNSI